jgi:hypothetical protein
MTTEFSLTATGIAMNRATRRRMAKLSPAAKLVLAEFRAAALAGHEALSEDEVENRITARLAANSHAEPSGRN